MVDLKTAINIVEIIAGFGATLVIGDYVGYKIGRWRLAIIVAVAVLVIVVAFAILSAVVLSK